MPSRWLDDIVRAIENRGGIATLPEIYDELQLIRPNALLFGNWDATVRATIETHSSDSLRFAGHKANDIFYSVEGIGKGVWGLRKNILHSPVASDLEKPQVTKKVKVEVYRILRDTSLARRLKNLHQDSCQVCGLALQLASGGTYSEAHHIKPLGSPHNGPDIAENILVLCPNHHVILDFGAKKLNLAELRMKPTHQVASEFVNYHNTVIAKVPDDYPPLFP